MLRGQSAKRTGIRHMADVLSLRTGVVTLRPQLMVVETVMGRALAMGSATLRLVLFMVITLTVNMASGGQLHSMRCGVEG